MAAQQVKSLVNVVCLRRGCVPGGLLGGPSAQGAPSITAALLLRERTACARSASGGALRLWLCVLQERSTFKAPFSPTMPRWIHSVDAPSSDFVPAGCWRWDALGALDCHGQELVQKLARAANTVARATVNGCLFPPQGLSMKAGRAGDGLSAGESLNTGQCVNGYYRRPAPCCRASKISSSFSFTRQC